MCLASLVLPAALGVACGKVADLTDDAGLAGDVDASSIAALDGRSHPDHVAADASEDTGFDAAPGHPDGGPPPVVACASPDAGAPCPNPPSVCLDDHWMRYYGNGMCTDAGTCAFEAYDLQCDPAPTPPDCYQGGCRITIVR